MKNLKKIIPLAFVSVLAISSVPANTNIVLANTVQTGYGNDSEDLPVLTVKQATDRAIENSSQIKTAINTLDISDTQVQKVRDGLEDATNIMQTLAGNANIMRLDLQRALAYDNIDMIQDALRLGVASYFAGIVRAEQQLRLYDQNLDIAEKDLEIMKTKVNLGLESQANYTVAKSKFSTNKNNRNLAVSSIDAAYRELNRLMDEKDQDKKYRLEFDLNNQDIDNVNLNSVIANTIARSISVKSAANAADVSTYELDNYVDDMYDPYLGGVIKNSTKREEREKAVEDANIKLNDAEKDVKNKVIDTYNKITDLRTNIQAEKYNLEQLYTQLGVLETQLSVGQVIQLDVDKFKYQIAQLEEQIRANEVDYNLLVMKFENPNMLLADMH